MLNTIYLRTFLAVVDAGSYTAAAELLHMSQPAVSQHIRSLEAHLGDVRLFRRSGQRMIPTHAGEQLLSGARELMRVAERTEQNIRALRGQLAGRVTIGCTQNSGEYLLPLLLSVFHVRHPAVTLSVQIASGETLLELLADKQVGVVFLEEQQRRRGWEARHLGREPLTLLAPAGHPLLDQSETPPTALTEHPLIMPTVGSPLRRTLEDGLRRRGIVAENLNIVLECDSLSITTQAVQGGVGIAFVPQTRLADDTALAPVTLSGVELHQDWFVLRERGQGVPLAVQEFYEFLTSLEAREILHLRGLVVPG